MKIQRAIHTTLRVNRFQDERSGINQEFNI